MKLTIGTTYYNNPEYLIKFIDRNFEYVDEIIIVDDGSSLPISDFVTPTDKIKLFRVTEDIGFNSHGCRNLIMKQAKNNWIILMDIDREFIFVEEAYKTIYDAHLNPDTLYRFMAHSNIKESHISVNDFLIHRNHFFSAGGYDEELIGMRTGDREYFKQLLHFGREKVLYGVDMLLTRKPSAQIKHLARSQNDRPIDKSIMKLIDHRINFPNPEKPILTFNWVQL